MADRAPVVVGAKVTLMVQFPPASTCVPQLLVGMIKSAALGCVIWIFEILSVAVPVLVRVRGNGLLDCPTTVLGNDRLGGEKLTDCADKGRAKETTSSERIPTAKETRCLRVIAYSKE